MTATAFYLLARIAGGFALSLTVHIIKTPEPEFRSFEAIELELRAINAWRIAERDERL